jgi:hypothetical protein
MDFYCSVGSMGWGTIQNHRDENRAIVLSDLQRSLKIVRRERSKPKLVAVEVEADEQSAGHWNC